MAAASDRASQPSGQRQHHTRRRIPSPRLLRRSHCRCGPLERAAVRAPVQLRRTGNRASGRAPSETAGRCLSFVARHATGVDARRRPANSPSPLARTPAPARRSRRAATAVTRRRGERDDVSVSCPKPGGACSDDEQSRPRLALGHQASLRSAALLESQIEALTVLVIAVSVWSCEQCRREYAR